jgi:hypothetical protein
MAKEVIATQVKENTTREDRAALAILGFVRIDGLKVERAGQEGIVELRSPGHLGTYSTNNDVTCLTTLGGEIWVSVNHPAKEDHEVLSRLATNPNMGYVWFSNAEVPNWVDLIKRVADPDYEPK